jgi:formiminotetrahydrofolate cyclodeaminase
MINLQGIEDVDFKAKTAEKANEILNEVREKSKVVEEKVSAKLEYAPAVV